MQRVPPIYIDIPALRPGTVGAYVLALVCAAVATALRIAIDPYVSGLQFGTFYAAVVVTTLISGFGAGLFCIVLSAAAAYFSLIEPRFTLYLENPADVPDLLLFILLSLFIATLVGALRSTAERYRELSQRLEQSQERLGVVVGELQHRTRNLISIVAAIADSTLRSSKTFDDFSASFRDRLGVLGRAQGLLSGAIGSNRVSFDELLNTELAAHSVHVRESGAVTLHGPRGVRLRSRTVQPLAMALHELLTNAVKYGALKQPNGHLTIRWQEFSGEDGKPWLQLDWKETGVEMPPAGAACGGTGQGRELIERALPYQFDAQTTFAMESDGVHCTISLPLSEMQHLGRDGRPTPS
jgi:two-component sensor histidine kinase